jgi:hypothetical protein
VVFASRLAMLAGAARAVDARMAVVRRVGKYMMMMLGWLWKDGSVNIQ